MPPEEFERARKGDCEDFALYAWRQVISLNYPARFVVGSCGRYGAGHAWITLDDQGRTFILEQLASFYGPRMARLKTRHYEPDISVSWDGAKPHFYKHEKLKFVPPPAMIPQLVAELLYLDSLPFLRLLAALPVGLPRLVYRKLRGRKRPTG